MVSLQWARSALGRLEGTPTNWNTGFPGKKCEFTYICSREAFFLPPGAYAKRESFLPIFQLAGLQKWNVLPWWREQGCVYEGRAISPDER